METPRRCSLCAQGRSRRAGRGIAILAVVTQCDEIQDRTSFFCRRVSLPFGELRLLQPSDGAELPDDGPVEWAPLAPYWSVLWRSGVALGREVADSRLAGLRVLELGCGLGVPSLVAARAGAEVLATDRCAEALDLLEQNARENGLSLATARVEWGASDRLVARGPFDVILAADVLYERASVAPLLSLLPRLGREVWLADPGRGTAAAFLEQAGRHWSVETTIRDAVQINRLLAIPRGGGALAIP
jgi:predicted nicotinamide N-methyase